MIQGAPRSHIYFSFTLKWAVEKKIIASLHIICRDFTDTSDFIANDNNKICSVPKKKYRKKNHQTTF